MELMKCAGMLAHRHLLNPRGKRRFEGGGAKADLEKTGESEASDAGIAGTEGE